MNGCAYMRVSRACGPFMCSQHKPALPKQEDKFSCKLKKQKKVIKQAIEAYIQEKGV